jgi:hypothetical protein
MPRLRALIGALFLTCFAAEVVGQDLEPRRWTHLPAGTNVASLGYFYTSGDLHFDPVLRIEDAQVELQTVMASTNHYFDLGGMTSRLDLQLPVSAGRWEGILDGVPRTVRREGLADPRIRFSVDLAGAPALGQEEFQEYLESRDRRTIVGAALAVRVPLGEYAEDKLINLGENRFGFQPQLGVVHVEGSWSFELTASVFLLTRNGDFFNGRTLDQDATFAVQAHVVKTFGKVFWFSVGAAYGRGGETRVDGVSNDDDRSNLLYGVTFGWSVNDLHSIQAGYLRQDALRSVGMDAHTVLLGWAIRF